MRKRILGVMVLGALAAAGGCAASGAAGDRSEADPSAGRAGVRDLVVGTGGGGGASADEPVTLFEYVATDATGRSAIAYGVSVFQARTGAVKNVRLSGCSLSQALRMFSLANPASEPPRVAVRPDDATLSCPSTIAPDAKVIVEPSARGSSYVEMRDAKPTTPDGGAEGGADAAAPASEPVTYVKMPNRCAGLLDAFDVGERAASEPPGSTSAAPPDSAVALELACGDVLDAPPVDVWEVGSARFAGMQRSAVYVRSGRLAFLVGRVDHVDLEARDLKAARDSVIQMLSASLGARGAVRSGYRTLALAFAPGSVTPGFETATTLPVVDLCSAVDCSGFVPAHLWINGNDPPACATAADPAGAMPTDCSGAGRISARLELRADGRAACAARLAAPGVTASASIELPSCADGEPWNALLHFTMDATPPPWFTEYDDATIASLLRPAAGGGPLRLPRLDAASGCEIDLDATEDLSAVSLGDRVAQSTQAGCSNPSSIDVVLPASISLSSGPFSIDAATLPAGVEVRVRAVGDGSRATIFASEPSCGNGGALCAAPVPVVMVTGALSVQLVNLTVAGPAGDTASAAPRPALTRIGVKVVGRGPSASDRAHVTLRNVALGGAGGADGPPLYTGVDAYDADVVVVSSSVEAFRSAMRVAAGSLEILGDASTAKLFSGVGAKEAPVMDIDGTSLDGTVANFPVLSFGSGARAFVANALLDGPLGIAWAADRSLHAGPDGLFWATEHSGDAVVGGVSGGSTMVQMKQGGQLRFVAPKVHHQGTVVRCDAAPGGIAPRVTLVQQTMKCIAQGLRNGRPAYPSLGVCQLEATPLWTPSPASLWNTTTCATN